MLHDVIYTFAFGTSPLLPVHPRNIYPGLVGWYSQNVHWSAEYDLGLTTVSLHPSKLYVITKPSVKYHDNPFLPSIFAYSASICSGSYVVPAHHTMLTSPLNIFSDDEPRVNALVTNLSDA